MSAVQKHVEPQLPMDTSPPAVIARALTQGVPIADLKELMMMQERWEATQARKAYNAAFSAFKAEAVVVAKGTKIEAGPLLGKSHANLFDVVIATTGPLAKHGLSASWKLTKDEPGWMEVTCVLSHIDGHSESVSMGGAPDTGPGRNAIQARGSTKTYLERYTLMGILGLAATDTQDDDGRGGLALVTADQAATLQALLEEVKADKTKYLKWLSDHCKTQIQSIEDLPACVYKDAVNALNAKRHKGEKK